MKNKTIILASASPRRAKLLKKIIEDFEIIPSKVDESKITANTPEEFAKSAALAKAKEVAKNNPNAVVIGADTIVVLEGKILGKPKDKKDAFAMLQSLSGKTHQVITGIAIVDGKKITTGVETTQVTMKKIATETIRSYVESNRPLDKAGSYGIQEIEGEFVEKVEGDYDNVVGLPTQKLKKLILT